MKADEQIRLVVVCHRCPFVDRHIPIVVPREEHANAETAFDGGLDAPRDGQRQLFFHSGVGAARAGIDALVEPEHDLRGRFEDAGPVARL